MSDELVRRSDGTMAKELQSGTAYLLWLGGLLGLCGLHRIYMGRWVSGLLWLFTGGFCFVGQIIDLVAMPRMIEDSNRGAGW